MVTKAKTKPKPRAKKAPSTKSKAKPLARFEFEPIGIISSCFKEKFGIPRQPGLVQASKGIIKLRDDPDFRTAIKSLEMFSHLWLVFVFHDHGGNKWKPSIRPPRLGGKIKVGSLASRSPHRPNPIGLSAVTLEKVDVDAPGGAEIHVAGLDLLDGTPILDLKPYIPYADSIPDAKAGWAEDPILRAEVEFTPVAIAAIDDRARGYAHLKQLIIQMLELDPRPAFQQRNLPLHLPEAQGCLFGIKLLGYDVKYEIRNQKFLVLDVVDVPPAS
jgi:tRNA-Thr(GGU) m(6)t(6)A37 methyltransferase TsaA